MTPDPETPDLIPPPLPVESAIAADQVAAHTAEGHGHHGPFHSHCENCGTKLEGPFCHKCGQHDFEFHRSFWHVFLEGLESFLHFDSKLFQTVATLIFRPGRLTKEFNAGKRASQMPPLRLYIFVSLVFFFLFFLDSEAPDRFSHRGVAPNAKVHEPDDETKQEIRQAWEEAGKELADKPHGKRAVDIIREAAEKTQAAQLARASEQAEKSVVADAPKTEGTSPAPPTETKPRKKASDSEFLRWLKAQGERASDPEHQREMAEHFIHAVPKLLLFCLPVFALYTRVLFRKSGLVYLQHLVLALHFHTVIFLWSMMKDGWVFLAGFVSSGLATAVAVAAWIWLLIYPVLMLRELFGNSWVKTVFKAGLLCSVYFMTLSFAAAVAGFLIFAML